MTAEDLKELGIYSFGHRRKLLNAIATLGAAPLTLAQAAASATSAPASPPTIDAERRQLTVIFCDLVGSTSLSTRHEDDAERAVRAGLAVIEAVGRLPAREDLRVRLGIATGLAVVGDLIGEGAAQERGVVGETPNLAARLQALSTPNTLVIGDATRRQIGGLFDLEDLGPQQLAGFAEVQRTWRVLGEAAR
jgi:class 3 adenylate cyclase